MDLSITDAPFTILVDPARCYVEIAMVGLWDVAIARRYDAELRAALPRLAAGGCPINQQVTRIDNRRFPVQTQDVSAILADMVADRSIASRRIALVLTAAIAKLQARRIASDYRIFADRDAALAWLFEPVGGGFGIGGKKGDPGSSPG